MPMPMLGEHLGSFLAETIRLAEEDYIILRP
jgi:hypothetical protein